MPLLDDSVQVLNAPAAFNAEVEEISAAQAPPAFLHTTWPSRPRAKILKFTIIPENGTSQPVHFEVSIIHQIYKLGIFLTILN